MTANKFYAMPAAVCCLSLLMFLCQSCAVNDADSQRNGSGVTVPLNQTLDAPRVQAKRVGYPKDGRLYHGVHPADGKGDESAYIDEPKVLKDYLDAAFPSAAPHRGVAWVYLSHEWEDKASWDFPCEAVRRIDEVEKSIPFIRLMLRTTYDATEKEEKFFTFDRILHDTEINAALAKWGRQAAQCGKPLVVEYGTEVNSETFPWNGAYNGSRREAAEKFKQVYRHIVQVIEGAGASNITWVFHVTTADEGTPDWNTIKSYYPGPDLIDWVGISIYGPQTKAEECRSFADVMKVVMDDPNGVRSLEGGKPLFILETGVVKGYPSNKPNGAQCEQGLWAEKALETLALNPWELKVSGFSWWNEGWDSKAGYIDMRVQSNDRLKRAFRGRITGDRFIHSPIYEP